MEKKPSHNPELGQEYIYNAAKAAAEKGDRLWQIDENDKTLAAASTKETDEAVIIENIGSIEKGKGKELLKQIAHYAQSIGKKLNVSATFDTESYYKELGFVPVPGSNNVWTIGLKDIT